MQCTLEVISIFGNIDHVAPFPDHQQFYEGSPFDKNKHQIDYSIPKEGRPEIFMWDVFKKKGYVTMKCIDMCPESYAYPSCMYFQI